jgi:hypothetical protein
MKNQTINIKDTSLSVDYVVERDTISTDRGDMSVETQIIKAVYIGNRNVIKLLSENLFNEIHERLTN